MTTDVPAEAKPKGQRIAKAMARAGLCSRRDAEAWINDGRVSVNGVTLSSPAFDVSPDDQVLVDGVPLPAAEKTRLFLFHKPRGLVTSDHDPEGRPTVADYLAENWPEGPRVVTVGRLDINTEGLLLLTNDGGLARVLELPQTGWLRRYRVRAKGSADVAALDALADGITIDGIDYAGIEAKLDRVQGANCWLTMGLREGKNREIKRVLEHLGLGVNRLIRLSFGPFQLLDLPEGAVEEVRSRVLRDQLGATLAQEAGVKFDKPAPQTRDRSAREAATLRPPPNRTREGGPNRRDRDRREAPHRADRAAGRDVRETPAAERPKPRARQHVSALRAAETESARFGPRKRTLRGETRDRHDRPIAVERLVKPRHEAGDPQGEGRSTAGWRGGRSDEPARRTPRAPEREGARFPSEGDRRERSRRHGTPHEGTRGDGPRGQGGRGQDGRGQGGRNEGGRGDGRRGDGGRADGPRFRPRRDDETRPVRDKAGAPRRERSPMQDGPRPASGERRPSRHASPSSLGKRERIARSGGGAGERPARSAKPPRSDGPGDRPGDRSGPRRNDRASDRSHGDRPRGDRPRQGKAGPRRDGNGNGPGRPGGRPTGGKPRRGPTKPDRS